MASENATELHESYDEDMNGRNNISTSQVNIGVQGDLLKIYLNLYYKFINFTKIYIEQSDLVGLVTSWVSSNNHSSFL